MAKKIFVTVGSFINIGGERRYCRGYECVQIPRPKNMGIPKNFKATREFITEVAKAANLSDLDNIFIERINGEPLPRPAGLYKKVDWVTGETEVDDYNKYKEIQAIVDSYSE